MFFHLSVSYSVHKGLCILACNGQGMDTPLGRGTHSTGMHSYFILLFIFTLGPFVSQPESMRTN